MPGLEGAAGAFGPPGRVVDMRRPEGRGRVTAGSAGGALPGERAGGSAVAEFRRCLVRGRGAPSPSRGAGRSGKGSTRVSSMTGGAGCGGFGMTAASECPPQPYARETTRPSAGENSLAHTPKACPREPPIGTRKPQLTQAAGAACAIGVFAPKASSQRSAATWRPYRERTRARRMPSSSATAAMEPRVGAEARWAGVPSVTSASSASASSAMSAETAATAELGGGSSAPV
ncbi:hypothetical protein GCM10020256_43030 [Streptomyces thermocoprophilus]